jgi:hypothetical protein
MRNFSSSLLIAIAHSGAIATEKLSLPAAFFVVLTGSLVQLGIHKKPSYLG